MSWSARFLPPVPLPAGGELQTLDDARRYVLNLPDDVAALPAWQTAIGALLMVGENGGPSNFAWIGMMQALHPRAAPVFDTSRKDRPWGRRKLARDR